MSAMWLMIVVLLVLAIAYRYYSAFLAAKVAALDDTRVTPAHVHNDGQNFHPTNKWVLFGHHFAAISGAGPLIGPVLAIQFGWAPGLIWILIGVCLAGAVQDMLVLAASVRHGGKSLAEIVREQVGRGAGTLVGLAILFIVVIALAGLGSVVVKALGGETVALAGGARTAIKKGEEAKLESEGAPASTVALPAGTRIGDRHYEEPLRLTVPAAEAKAFVLALNTRAAAGTPAVPAIKPDKPVVEGQARPSLAAPADGVPLPKGSRRLIKGSSWGTFTIAATIPIALFVGLYMYRLRPGRVVEASLIGGALTLGATVVGAWVPGTALGDALDLSKEGVIVAMGIYGFIACVLPVWLLLGPRDYLSSFLKIGTIALLVAGVIAANPKLEAPAVNMEFASGGGPTFPQGGIFPFVFICVMCGAVSGFHSLVSSGTTPKMIDKESHVRPIGYAAMLIEGLVGITALVAAASLPTRDYYDINIPLDAVPKFEPAINRLLQANPESMEHPARLAEIERAVGEDLRGRTGGAVTLAVGIAEIFDRALPFFGGLISYWYHFAIMFEALFILTTIDAGTRIARFLLQEHLGKIYEPMGRPNWLPGAIITGAAVTFGWCFLIWNGSIDTIWPMFGIANQLLAVIALCGVTTWLINSGRGRYAWVTMAPMCFVITTTTSAAACLLATKEPRTFRSMIQSADAGTQFSGWLSAVLTLVLVLSVLIVVAMAARKWIAAWRAGGPTPEVPAKG